jgi:transposase-like protein
MAIWPDGTQQIFHYEVAPQESQTEWQTFFEHLAARGVDLSAVELVVSDGTNGLPPVLETCLPNALRCTPLSRQKTTQFKIVPAQVTS